jgi:hypothetical protein
MNYVSKCCSAPAVGDLEVDDDRKVAFGYCKDCGCKSSFVESKSPTETPRVINELGENEIFTFGGNRAGRHGAGAALTALKKFGARYGNGEGLQGRSYSIPTKGWNIETLPLSEIAKHVSRFIDFATHRSDLTFLVTPIGTGLAGYSAADIAPMFSTVPLNVVLPREFKQPNKTTAK